MPKRNFMKMNLEIKNDQQEKDKERLSIYRILMAVRLLDSGARVIPLTKTGKLLEEYSLEHGMSKKDLVTWFGLLEYDIGIVTDQTIMHIHPIYAKENGETQHIATERIINSKGDDEAENL